MQKPAHQQGRRCSAEGSRDAGGALKGAGTQVERSMQPRALGLSIQVSSQGRASPRPIICTVACCLLPAACCLLPHQDRGSSAHFRVRVRVPRRPQRSLRWSSGPGWSGIGHTAHGVWHGVWQGVVPRMRDIRVGPGEVPPVRSAQALALGQAARPKSRDAWCFAGGPWDVCKLKPVAIFAVFR